MVSSSLTICFLAIIGQIIAFKAQYFGNSLTEEEYRAREFCSTKVCLLDSDRLISSVTQNQSVNPCDDFKVYAMGEFLKHRVVNDRYPVLSFELEVLQKFNAQNRKLLSQPVTKSDVRMTKVIKSFYKKCVNSDLVKSEGVKDFTNHLNNLGEFPLTSNGTWNEANFTIERIVYDPTIHFTSVFLGHELSRCNDPRNRSNEVICFKIQNEFEFYDSVEKDYLDLLKPLTIDQSVVKSSLKDFFDFQSLKQTAYNKHKNDSERRVVNINEMNKLFPTLKINWLRLMNLNMLKDSQVTEDQEIGIENPELFQSLLATFITLDKRIVANVVAVTFAAENKQTFDVYALSPQEGLQLNSKKSVNRFERCLLHLSILFTQAFTSFTATKYYDEKVQSSARKLALEAVHDSMEVIEKKVVFDDMSLKKTIFDKLKSMKLSIMYPDEALNQSLIEEFYNELPIDGSEPLLSMIVAIKFHQKKVNLAEKTNWMRKLLPIFSIYRKYLIDENILVVPVHHTLYPSYHPDRSRFFNMATFYMQTAENIFYSISNYLKQHSKSVVNLGPDSALNLAYENYVRWEANGGKELELSPFRLTNRQMMWLSMANRLTNKFHRNAILQNPYISYVINLSDFFKALPGFIEAFACNTTEVKFKF